jgi:Immunoglobulin-like domain of bacterial spore germination
MKRSTAVILGALLLGVACAKAQGTASGPSGPPGPSVTTPSPSPAATGDGTIVVDSPRAGDTVASPFTISGAADVFEAVVSYRLLDDAGTELASGTTLASCGTGCRGDFRASVKFVANGDQPARLELFEASAKDGSPTHMVQVPLTLTGSTFQADQGGVLVQTPEGGSVQFSPIGVTGRANVFEATVSMRLVDADGNELAATFATATCGTGCWGDFEAALAFSVDHDVPATLEVYQASAEDGSPLDLVRIPITLSP